MSGFGLHGKDLSIMIPHYNCTELLKETLDALKSQTLDISEAQIELVDNCSTKGDPESVIQTVWGDRVAFHCNPTNVGLIQNFNACIERSSRKWVYILHSDDFPARDGLEAMDALAAANPAAEVLFGRYVGINAQGIAFGLARPLGLAMSGLFEVDPALWCANPTQFVTTIVTADAYRSAGMFPNDFGFASDFWTWWTLASTKTTAYTNHLVGYYRQFEGSQTSAMQRDAVNTGEAIQVLKKIGAELYGSVERAATAGHFRMIQDVAYEQAIRFLGQGDFDAYRANLSVVLDSGIDPFGRFRSLERKRKMRRILPKLRESLRGAPGRNVPARPSGAEELGGQQK
jgi:glycosyltransferase involved in cell wall biosynthesis